MSNSKRNAQEAFEGDSEHQRERRKQKRSRRNRAQLEDSAHAKLKVNKKPITEAHKSSSKSLVKESKSKSKPQKLEDRIESPSSKSKTSALKAVESTDSSAKPKKNKHKRNHNGKTESKSKDTSTSLKKVQHDSKIWRLSVASGGVFLDHDPIFSADGQYLILPTKDRVCIYSVSTSLLVRSITIKEDIVVGCFLSLKSPNALFVNTAKGTLMKFDLSTTSRIGRWKIGAGFHCMKNVAVSESDGEEILAIKSKARADESLAYFTLLDDDSKTSSLHLMETQDLKRIVFMSQDGSSIICCGHRRIHVGMKRPGQNSNYTWHDFEVPGSIACSDGIAITESEASAKKIESVHVVVGLDDGSILVYEDILSKALKANRPGQKLEPTGRKLHWHRNQVRSVKWSKDGNYIISGGDETTLVIWQLETNQQQFLPHLSTSILNITVSHSGAQYALRLGDNSVMVLSTADLAPTTNITGLSISFSRNERLPMQMHPGHPNRLLAAVPIRPVSKDTALAATHLQTYDIEANLQLSRQALTRNVTTTVNIAPDGRLLDEPSVILLQASFDGHWLATVERWTPSSSDMEGLYLKEDDHIAKQKNTETTLRFWLWRAEDDTWELVTRIDEPHTASKYAVLGLASNPTTPEFATMGEDGFIKVWQPRRRIRNGVQVRDKAGHPLFTWTCARSIQVEKAYSISNPFASLTYSEDGSVIAASWSVAQPHVHIIDPVSSTVSMSLPDLLVEGPTSLAIVGRYLLCLSNTLKVFDMITLETTFTMDLVPHKSSWLAVNTSTNAFAIGLNTQDKTSPTSISIFDIEKPERGPSTDLAIPGQIRALLAEPTARGYILIDSDAKIRRILPPGPTTASSTALAQISDANELDTRKSLQDIFGREAEAAAVVASSNRMTETQQKLIENGESSENLADLVSVPSTASQPAIGELFDRISRAIAGVHVRVDV